MKKLKSLKPIVDEKSKIMHYGDDKKNSSNNQETEESRQKGANLWGTNE